MRRLIAALAVALSLVGATPAYADQGQPAPAVDYSWYRPSQGELAPYPTVVRYLVPAAWASGKAITAQEARWLLAQGKAVVLNFEWSASGMLGGWSAGVRDAKSAELARTEIGAPATLPIYFSADWDVQPGQVGAVLDYLAGVASVIGRGRTGIYGGYRAVRAALDAGYPWGWQTYAWSGGRWDPRAQLRQVSNGAVWSGQGDLDTVITDPGGWWTGTTLPGPGDSIRPRPVPAPPPPAAAWYTVRAGDYLASIASRYGTTWQRLAQINRLANPNRIYPGQPIRLA